MKLREIRTRLNPLHSTKHYHNQVWKAIQSLHNCIIYVNILPLTNHFISIIDSKITLPMKQSKNTNKEKTIVNIFYNKKFTVRTPQDFNGGQTQNHEKIL